MNIDFPCPESICNMQKNESGFACNSCNESVYDLSKLNTKQLSLLQSSGQKICAIVYSNKEVESTYSIRKFALALLIVFGSGLFIIANAQMEKQLKSVTDSTAVCPLIKSKIVVSVQNKHNHSIWADVSLKLPNGKSIEFTSNTTGVYFVEVPAFAIGKEIEVEVRRSRMVKSEIIVVDGLDEIIDLDYVFYSKRASRRYRYVGCPSF